MQRPGKHALVAEAALYRLLHRMPDGTQVVPYVGILEFLGILPESPAGILAPLYDLPYRVERIYVGAGVDQASLSFGKSTAAHAVDRPLVGGPAFGVLRGELHAVRVVRQGHVAPPEYVHGRAVRSESIPYSDIGKMSLSRRGKAAVERDLESRRPGMTAEEYAGRPVRPHGVAARRAAPYLVEFL